MNAYVLKEKDIDNFLTTEYNAVVDKKLYCETQQEETNEHTIQERRT